MKGKKYDSDKVRLLVIGRAVNGWSTFPCESASVFAKYAETVFNHEGFQWINYEYGKPISNYINEQTGKAEIYRLSNSAFWRTAENVWRGLSSSDDICFTDHIAWSNLYKIAPKISGNPTVTMCKKQYAACKDILKAEIEAYRPTHILFITGYRFWYADTDCNFSVLFKNNNCIGSNSENTSVLVEGTSEYRLEDGTVIPAVISCRPERRDENALCKTILSTFQRKQIDILTQFISPMEYGEPFASVIQAESNNGVTILPAVKYTDFAKRFINAFFSVTESNPGYSINELLSVYEHSSLANIPFEKADISKLDCKSVLSLIAAVLHNERWDNGTLYGFFICGKLTECLKRLSQIYRIFE